MADRFDLLFVCTGNICRSPTAELYAAHHLDPERFRVHSAGTHGLDGWPIEPSAARRLADLGIGCDAFRARRLTAEMVERADLVLTATRVHRDQVVALVPDARGRTFTMRELARRVEGGPETGDDDVADPYGLGDAAYDQALDQIVAALRRPLELLQSGHDVLGS